MSVQNAQQYTIVQGKSIYINWLKYFVIEKNSPFSAFSVDIWTLFKSSKWIPFELSQNRLIVLRISLFPVVMRFIHNSQCVVHQCFMLNNLANRKTIRIVCTFKTLIGLPLFKHRKPIWMLLDSIRVDALIYVYVKISWQIQEATSIACTMLNVSRV